MAEEYEAQAKRSKSLHSNYTMIIIHYLVITLCTVAYTAQLRKQNVDLTAAMHEVDFTKLIHLIIVHEHLES